MTDARTIQLTFAVNDPELDDEERQEIAQKLLRQLKQLDEVERVERAEDLSQEEGARSVLATLVGVLTTEVSASNLKTVLDFIGGRLGNKPIKIKIKVGGQEAEIEAQSAKDLPEVERVANNLLEQMKGSGNA